MIWRVTKLVAVGVLVRRAVQNPKVATPARAVYGRFAKSREAGRWHDVDPPVDQPVDRSVDRPGDPPAR